MNKIGTNKIETERLILRKIRMSDAPKMYENWASDNEVTKYLLWDTYKSVKDAELMIANWMESAEDPTVFRWVIVDKETEEPIGSIDCVSVSVASESCEIGYCLSKNYWNKGIMTEALQAVIKYLFEMVDMHRVSARHMTDNPASGVVMEKAGMSYEGLMKDGVKHKGKFKDLKLWAIINDN